MEFGGWERYFGWRLGSGKVLVKSRRSRWVLKYALVLEIGWRWRNLF